MSVGLLLLHSWGTDSSMWEPQIATFSGRLPVIAPDLPGFGNSPARPAVMTMEMAADAAIESMDEAKIDRVVACGISMGATVALALWRRYPERVAGLVLANASALPVTDDERTRREGMAARLRQHGLEPLIAARPPMFSADAPETVWEWFFSIVRNQRADALAAASIGLAQRENYLPHLPNIAIPTLVITSNDLQSPPAGARQMANLIPNSSFEVIEDAGHVSSMESPVRFNDLLREHLIACGL